MAPSHLNIGLISDTHDLLRPEALAALQGSDHIIHAGDICGSEVLTALREIAPLTVVRGNNDRGDWAKDLPETALLQVGEVRIHVLHDLAQLRINAQAAGIHVVVWGHSHRPRVEERDGVLWINPGSAGPRRFNLPVSVARLVVTGATVSPQVLELNVGTKGKAKVKQGHR